MVKNLPSNAGGTSSIPGQGTKILPALEQLCHNTQPMTVLFGDFLEFNQANRGSLCV